jgi:flavodoxin
MNMPKTAILYRSPHHGNTRKLLDAIAAAVPGVDLILAGEGEFSPAEYDFIGFASGVYGGKLHRAVRKVLDTMNADGRRAFVIYTCGDSQGSKYGERFLNMLRQKGYKTCGFYFCIGHDSFGPMRLIGGINKGRPNGEDIQGAVAFYENLIS